MTTRREMLNGALLALPACALAADDPAPPAAKLFAVEFRTGPAWDANKQPQDQLHFREHSANLKRLRDAGRLLVGARYSDKGLIVLSAATEAEARAEIAKDPTVQAKVFAYEIHPFMVFYSGCLGTARA
jgi:uncharacterized protein YciI